MPPSLTRLAIPAGRRLAGAAGQERDYPWTLIPPLELADGATLLLRPIRPDDQPRLVELFSAIEPAHGVPAVLSRVRSP